MCAQERGALELSWREYEKKILAGGFCLKKMTRYVYPSYRMREICVHAIAVDRRTRVNVTGVSERIPYSKKILSIRFLPI